MYEKDTSGLGWRLGYGLELEVMGAKVVERYLYGGGLLDLCGAYGAWGKVRICTDTCGSEERMSVGRWDGGPGDWVGWCDVCYAEKASERKENDELCWIVGTTCVLGNLPKLYGQYHQWSGFSLLT